jgi:hypothetical protein
MSVRLCTRPPLLSVEAPNSHCRHYLPFPTADVDQSRVHAWLRAFFREFWDIVRLNEALTKDAGKRDVKTALDRLGGLRNVYCP